MIYRFILVSLCILGKCPKIDLKELRQNFLSSFNSQIKCCTLNQVGVTVNKLLNVSYGNDYKERIFELIKENPLNNFYFVYPDGYVDTASGTLNGRRINTNARTANMLSIFMHEFGHNLGFDHAGLGDKEYGDTTGYMGSSGGNSTFPRKCYNSFNNYHSGYFDICKIEVFKEGRYSLTGFLSGKKNCILKVGSYYIQYNKKTSCNRDQGSRVDRVIILKNQTSQTKFVSELYHNSVRLGKYIVSDCNHNFRFVPDIYYICVKLF